MGIIDLSYATNCGDYGGADLTTRIGKPDVSYSARGNPTFYVELWHDGLKKHRLIKSSSTEILQRKTELQVADWEEQWSKVEARTRNQETRDSRLQYQEARKAQAALRTQDAKRELERLNSILRHTLSVDDAIDWERLKDKSNYPEPRPTRPNPSPPPTPKSRPNEPNPAEPKYNPKIGFLDRLLGNQGRIIAIHRKAFEADHEKWLQEVKEIDAANAASEKHVLARNQEREQLFQEDLKKWNERRLAFIEKQRLQNEAIATQSAAYLSGSAEAITEYCDMVLSSSTYPDYFPKEFVLDYNPDQKIIVVDYSLPAPADLPTVREVKYVAIRDELVEQHLSQSQIDKIYDDVLYQTVLRTIHELFEADKANSLEGVTFNGIVTSIDKSTGNPVTACVLSLNAQRAEFLAINLASVDPKACFKTLKGVGSSKLHSLAAVAPIMQIRREDGRFISAYEVANTLDESSNLAAMDWEDFEHLIREVFEKEFSSHGGEVKVTQASRDGGVDAIAFDPDPIRGGKIVIQAKRYTNTVGVAAVRDLYGTVMNEGANKGILVTTSDYGPDAYAFASGKPLTLLNGSNLLHMLERHGHHVKIDIQAARRIAMNQPGKQPYV